MTPRQVSEVFARLNAVITNSHIVYTSGKHGTAYVNKDAIYPHTRETSQFCSEIADFFSEDGVQVVIAPAVGGVILSQWTAYHLTKIMGREVLGVYADKVSVDGEDDFVIKRGYDKLINGQKILVVEDLLTTGGSVRKVVRAVRAIGGTVIGVGVLCNRGGVTRMDIGDVPQLFTLLDVKMDAWDEADCPLCKQSVPINTDVGHGRFYLAQKKAV